MKELKENTKMKCVQKQIYNSFMIMVDDSNQGIIT